MIVTRKLKLVVVKENVEEKNKVYKYIRDEQYEQYKAMNLGMSLLYTYNQLCNVGSGAEKKLESQIKALSKKIEKLKIDLKSTKRNDKITSITKSIEENNKKIIQLREEFSNTKKSRILEDNQFKEKYIDEIYTVLQSQVNFENKDNMSLVIQKIKSDFSTALKHGMARGERSLTNYKRENPLMVRGRDLVLSKEDNNFYISWIKEIKFKVLIGRKDKDKEELLYTLNNVIEYQTMENIVDEIIDGKPVLDKKGKVKRVKNPDKDYKICDSSLQFEDNKLILNLCIEINNNNTKNEFVDGRVVGVDLGIKIPAFICLNDKYYIRKSIGTYESFMKVNTQMKDRRIRICKQINKAKSGKGRKRKLQVVDNLKEKRSNYNTTYNHYISKEIVKFALDNQAGQINIEFLTSETFKKDKFLADWSYYQLQQMIEYKAKKEGIAVKYVDPFRTSQTCTICGHYEKGQRETQAEFICKQCKVKINADYNAAQNIAKSTKFVESIEETEYHKLKNQGKFNGSLEEVDDKLKES